LDVIILFQSVLNIYIFYLFKKLNKNFIFIIMNINPRVLKYIRTNKSKRFTIENKVGNRLFQELNEDNSFNSVNGYYGLSKDAYPALNPKSFGEKAVSEWTLRKSVDNNVVLRRVKWIPELGNFLVVPNNSTKFQISNNGIDWTQVDVSFSVPYRQIAWSKELKRVVVGTFGSNNPVNSRLAYSDNLINWQYSDVSNARWESMVWSSELGLFVASNSVDTLRNFNRILTSIDGINWTPRASVDDTLPWRPLCWSPELGIFVNLVNKANANVITSKLQISKDGINWTEYPLLTEGNWTDMVWSKELGLFVVVGDTFFGSVGNQSSKIITSPDGINWTEQTNPDTTVDWFGIEWSPQLGLFVVVGNKTPISPPTSSTMITSNNGIDWKINTNFDNTKGWIGISWAPELGIFVSGALVSTGERLITSSLKGRPPTSFNVFDSSFNNIDNNGNISIKAKNLYSEGNIIIDPSNTLTVFGNVGINTTQPLCSLDISKNDGINLPSGTSLQRPINPQGGMIRYNTDINSIEWYNGNILLWASVTGIVATGGTITEITQNDINYRVHTFTTVGTSQFQVLIGGEMEYLVIAGGGGAQGGTSGGGGAGGYRCSVPGESSGGGVSAESPLGIPSGTYNIIVGAGGSGGSGPANDLTEGTNGDNSVFYTITSIGGGRGGGYINGGNINNALQPGIGGSGGGGQNYTGSGRTLMNGANGTVGQGFKGGDPESQILNGTNNPAGGGGGAGGAGTQAGSAIGQGDGGIGVQSNIDGVLTYRGGGGGGGASGRNNPGGLGGGGEGANGSGLAGNGVSNTGGGGGGGWTYASGFGGAGGSGIVIIRYKI
jgi:hypothetical protein